jgi:hypothetical protein
MTGKNVKQKFGSILFIIFLLCTGIVIIYPSTTIVKTAAGMSTWTQTSAADFQHGTFDNVNLVGSGNSAEVRLDLNFGWDKKSISPSPGGLEFHKMAMINGTDKVVLFGGMVDEDDTWIYDYSEDKWTLNSTHQLLLGRYNFGFAPIYNDDKILLYAGSGSILGCFDDQWLYDLSNDTWTEIHPNGLVGGRYSVSMAPIYRTDKVLLFGGYPSSYLNDTWIFDLSLNSWTQQNTTNSPTHRQHHAMTPIAGTNKVLLFGGYDGVTYFNDTWIYDLGENTWTNITMAIKPSARANHAMATIDCTDNVVLSGGYNGDNYFDDTWIFDLSSKTWSEIQFSSHPQARAGHTMATVYNTRNVILHGGGNGTNTYSDTWIYHHTGANDNGTYVSTSYDTGTNSTFNSISWESETPSGTSIKFQVRTAASKSKLNSKLFIGPDGTSGTYYESSQSTIWSGHGGDRWIQYKAYYSSSVKFVVLSLKDVTLTYNRWPWTILMSPINGSIMSNNRPIFKWNISDDSNDQEAFQVLIDDDINFSKIDYNSGEQPLSTRNWQFPMGTNYNALPEGKWYWRVRSKDSDGDWGPYSNPSMFIIDTTEPSSQINHPLNNVYYNYLEIISGTSMDNEPGTNVKGVEISIIQLSDGKYWNGNEWIDHETWLGALGTKTWEFDAISIPWISGIQYQIRSRAFDIVSNIEIPGEGVKFYVDSDDPISEIQYPADNIWLNSLDMIFGIANDTIGSGIDYVKINIKDTENNWYWNGILWNSGIEWLPVIGTENWTYNSSRVEWRAGIEYVITSRAHDKLNNNEFPGVKNRFKFDFGKPRDLAIAINDGEKYTNSSVVRLSLAANDLISGVWQMSFSTSGTNWTKWIPFKNTHQFELPDIDGEQLIYFRVRDYANNNAEPVSDSIILDTKPPANLSIVINGGIMLTNIHYVILALNATDELSGVHKISLSDDSVTWKDWRNYVNKIEYYLPPGDGEKTIYLRAIDEVGNIAEPVNDSIILNISISERDKKPEPEQNRDSTNPFSSYPIVWVVVLALVIILLIYLTFYKKRKEQDKKSVIFSKSTLVLRNNKPTEVKSQEITPKPEPVKPVLQQENKTKTS